MVFNQKKNAVYFTYDIVKVPILLYLYHKWKKKDISVFTHMKYYRCLGNMGLGLLQFLYRTNHISAHTVHELRAIFGLTNL